MIKNWFRTKKYSCKFSHKSIVKKIQIESIIIMLKNDKSPGRYLKKDISIENLNEALNQKKCRNKSLRKFNFILQNVIITHVIMIVNRKMASKNRDFAKYKKVYIFFQFSFQIWNQHEKISRKKYSQLHYSTKMPPIGFSAFWHKTGGNFWIFNFFQFCFHILDF